MTNWLIEIEKQLRKIKEKYGDAPISKQYNHDVMERMARVIREQSKIIKVTHTVDWEVIIDGLDMGETKQKLIAIWNLVGNLSPDAKELLK